MNRDGAMREISREVSPEVSLSFKLDLDSCKRADFKGDRQYTNAYERLFGRVDDKGEFVTGDAFVFGVATESKGELKGSTELFLKERDRALSDEMGRIGSKKGTDSVEQNRWDLLDRKLSHTQSALKFLEGDQKDKVGFNRCLRDVLVETMDEMMQKYDGVLRNPANNVNLLDKVIDGAQTTWDFFAVKTGHKRTGEVLNKHWKAIRFNRETDRVIAEMEHKGMMLVKIKEDLGSD